MFVYFLFANKKEYEKKNDVKLFDLIHIAIYSRFIMFVFYVYLLCFSSLFFSYIQNILNKIEF